MREAKKIRLARHLRLIISLQKCRAIIADEHLADIEKLVRQVEDENKLKVDRRIHACCADCTDYFEAHRCWFCGEHNHDLTVPCHACGRSTDDKPK